MGICMQKQRKEQKPSITQSKIESVDVVKVKLKHARDRIKNFIAAKSNDISKINEQIKEKLPIYQETKNKKPLVPLLQARKNLQKIIQNAEVRLKLVNQKLSEVQMSQMNADTVEVLEDSNKYIQKIQQELQAKDWRSIVEEAQNKYELEWPDDSEEIQEDPAFKEMWKQLGGEKIVEKKQVNVNVHAQSNTVAQQKKEPMLV